MRTPFNGKLALVLSTTLVGLAFSTGPALAQSCVAPPGTAGIDQYCESIPGPDGSHGPSDHSGGAGGKSGGSLPGVSRRALGHAGADGSALLNLTQGTAPPAQPGTTGTTRGGSGAGRPGGATPPASVPKSTSGNPLAAVGSAAKSGVKAGPGFVWLLVGIGLLIAGMGWLRFRRAAPRT